MIKSFGKHAVLWDMDGVIVDTGKFHFQSWMETFKEIGRTITEDQFKQTFGMNNAGILETLFGEIQDQASMRMISDRKEELFRDLVQGKAELLPGIRRWLLQFRKWGMKQAIASSAPPENIEAIVIELEIRQLFDALISGAELPGKPNPDVFLTAAKILGVSPANCIVIEDAIAGVEGAKRAGMKCVAVTTTNPASSLGKADLVLQDLNALTDDLIKALLA